MKRKLSKYEHSCMVKNINAIENFTQEGCYNKLKQNQVYNVH